MALDAVARFIKGSGQALSTAGVPLMGDDINVFKALKGVTVKKEGEESLSVWEPSGTNRYRLMGFVLMSSVTVTVTLEDESQKNIYLPLVANTPVAVQFPGRGVRGGTKAGGVEPARLFLKTSLEAVFTGFFYGTEDVA